MDINLTDSKYLDEIIQDENWWNSFQKECKECKNLLDRFLLYKACDDEEQFKLSEGELENLCILLNNIARTLERNTKKYWCPDWEICWGCSKRYTNNCDPDMCNPMGI